MKKDRNEVIMAGSGGQGLVVSGMMLAEAAIIERKNVIQAVSYGIASRGGFSMAEVIIDTEEIIFPKVQSADVVLALTEEAMEKFQSLASEGTNIFYDTTLLKERQGERLYGHPFTEMASKIGHVGMTNIIALGCMARIQGMVKTKSIVAVLRKRFSGKTLSLNLEALESGIALAK